MGSWFASHLVVVQLEAHAVVNLVVLQRDVVLIDVVPSRESMRYQNKVQATFCLHPTRAATGRKTRGRPTHHFCILIFSGRVPESM